MRGLSMSVAMLRPDNRLTATAENEQHQCIFVHAVQKPRIVLGNTNSWAVFSQPRFVFRPNYVQAPDGQPATFPFLSMVKVNLCESSATTKMDNDAGPQDEESETYTQNFETYTQSYSEAGAEDHATSLTLSDWFLWHAVSSDLQACS